ncbi:MAG: hypothetical protein JO324_02405, partial [Candidatus Eremiobacteraeota bacterium]|nr:hypothetical protein [Candidatus Eremiobacteraeota bacterium]
LYHQLLGRELLWHHVPAYGGDPHRELRWQRQFMAAATAITIAQAAVVTYGFERPLLQLKLRARGRRPSTRVAT